MIPKYYHAWCMNRSNLEQMVFCLHFVDCNLDVHEGFVGLYSIESTSTDSIVSTIKDVLLQMNLSLQNCRGQCYDGASSMSGGRAGVAKRITDLEHRAFYTHCYGHASNLAAQDAVKHSKIMEDCLDTTYEIPSS